MLRASAEAVSELPVLSGDTDRACVLGADTHHHTAEGYQRSCSKTEFLRSQKRRNSNVSAAHEFSVCLKNHSVTQAVLSQAPVRFREAKFPRKTRIMYGASGCSAGPSVIAGDQDHLCTCLCHTRCDGAYPCLRYKFDVDPGVPVGVLKIVDQLRQVLDGINVMMGRRRDQSDPGGRIAGLRHPRIHFFARKMSALARFCALGHLDLDLLRAAQVRACDAETSRSHLLDLAVFVRSEAVCLLSALSCV